MCLVHHFVNNKKIKTTSKKELNLTELPFQYNSRKTTESAIYACVRISFLLMMLHRLKKFSVLMVTQAIKIICPSNHLQITD